MAEAPEQLNDIYIDELKDLWSANDQMARVIKKLVTKATDATLKNMLIKSVDGINAHTETLKQLIVKHGEKTSKEHCKGMEGLVAEATKHAIDEAPEKEPLRDAVIIAQYQRMTHYGIAGFGTAAAYAKALGLDDDAKALGETTDNIYQGDDYMNWLAETTVNLQAEDA